jgi:hypothetical protein
MNDNDKSLLLIFAAGYQKKYPEMRRGQALMNALEHVSPEDAAAIHDSQIDCFYIDDRIDSFYEYLGLNSLFDQ